MAKLYITNEAKYRPPRFTYLARLAIPCGPSLSVYHNIIDVELSTSTNEFYIEVEGEDQVEIGNQVFYKDSGNVVNNKNIEIDIITTELSTDYSSTVYRRTIYRTDSEGFINKITICDINGNIYNYN